MGCKRCGTSGWRMKSLWVTTSVVIMGIVFMNKDITGQDFSSNPAVTPVIFIPGHGASRILAKLNRSEVIAPHCPRQSDWFTIWFNIWQMAHAVSFGHLDCLSDNLRTVYDPVTKTMKNVPGVSTKIDGFGSTETLEFLGDSWITKKLGLLQYGYPLFEVLTSWGYQRGQTLYAAPYDYRFAPHSQTEFMRNLKELIERTYSRNKKKVSIVAHSLGGLFGLYFLNSQTRTWKETYIHSLVTVNTPWRGSVMMVRALASGHTWDIPGLDPQTIRVVQRSTDVGIQTIPRGDVWKDHVFIQTPDMNYTVIENEQFLKEATFNGSGVIYKRLHQPDYDLVHPGIPYTCIASSGIPTIEKYIYRDTLINNPQPSEVVKGLGDGAINDVSLRACNQMKKKGEFHFIDIPNVAHVGILSDHRFFKDLAQILF